MECEHGSMHVWVSFILLAWGTTSDSSRHMLAWGQRLFIQPTLDYNSRLSQLSISFRAANNIGEIWQNKKNKIVLILKQCIIFLFKKTL